MLRQELRGFPDVPGRFAAKNVAPVDDADSQNIVAMAMVGTVGAFGGALVGGRLGRSNSGCSDSDWTCGLGGIIIGGAIGETLGMSLGVTALSPNPHRFGNGLLVSTAVGLGGITAFGAAGGNGAILLAVFAAQLSSTIFVHTR
ncbi:MAG: hypothetical protein O3C45_03385 [Bacteroidetes bacterium]|nr:hypothetical protein [Bacteroidota bacterium]MDA0874084.1 hypothetical protein [Bacteroidota bacterium]